MVPEIHPFLHGLAVDDEIHRVMPVGADDGTSTAGLEIADDSIGFDPNAVDPVHHVLAGMRESTTAFGGRLRTESRRIKAPRSLSLYPLRKASTIFCIA
jgi:hypothetical protein